MSVEYIGLPKFTKQSREDSTGEKTGGAAVATVMGSSIGAS